MESESSLDRGGACSAGDFVEVIDASNPRHGKVGRIAYFVGDNVYVTFGERRSSPKHMLFPEQLRAVPAPTGTGQRTAPMSRLLASAARLITLLHFP